MIKSRRLISEREAQICSVKRKESECMKILITTDWYKPVINGVVTSVDNLCSELLKMGFEVRILTLSNSPHSYKKGNVYYIGSVSVGAVYPQARLRIKWNREMIKELIAWKPDIVHSQCEFSTFVPARRIAESCDAPLVHTYHTAYEDYTHYFCPIDRLGKGAVKKFSEHVLNKTGAVIAPSKKVEDMLRRYDINSCVYVIPSGIDTEKFISGNDEGRERVRKLFKIGEDEFIMVYVGRLAKEKNLEEVLDIMEGMKASPVRLLIAGDGPYRHELEEKAERQGIRDRLLFAGMVSPMDVADYYRAGDVFVNASRSETQGLTYIEAMACRIPVLCRRDECLEDVIKHGENGFLYETAAEFENIVNMLRADEELRKTIGKNGFETAAVKFCAGAFASSCAKLYEECLNEGGFVS